MTENLINETVARIWQPGMGVNTLLRRVQESLRVQQQEQPQPQQNKKGENDNVVDVVVDVDVDVNEITKQKVKAAKLIIPYTYYAHAHSEKNELNRDNDTSTSTTTSSNSSSNSTSKNDLTQERIQFITQKIGERQECRKLRQFKEADYIHRGLVKMGVVMDDATKTWTYHPRQETMMMNSTDFENLSLQTSSFSSSTNTDTQNNKNNNVIIIRCEMCGKIFKSRNLVFKHLRDPGSNCGNSIFAQGQSLPIAPSIQKKKKKKEVGHNNNNSTALIRHRARTGKTAQHATSSSTVWFGDLPLPWTRAGGKYKRLRALIRQYLPRDIPQPWIKLVVRKAYRKRSELKNPTTTTTTITNVTEETEEEAQQHDKERIKDEYLGYAIIVFRCDEEAETIRKSLDGVQINSNHVFPQQQQQQKAGHSIMPEKQEDCNDIQLPSFVIKVRPANNGDTKITPQLRQIGQDPPLIEQLRPFTIDELKRRIIHLQKINTVHNNNDDDDDDDINQGTFNDEKKYNKEALNVDNNKNNNTKLGSSSNDNDIQTQELLLHQAVQLYKSISPTRTEIKHQGKLVPESLTKPLLEILTSLKWKVPNERGHLNAERYLVLPTNVTNDRFYGDLRQTCMDLMQWVDPSYFYSGIAVVRIDVFLMGNGSMFVCIFFCTYSLCFFFVMYTI